MFALLAGLAGLAVAVNAPFVSGETLVYQLSWHGLLVGEQQLSAIQLPDGGWHFAGRVKPRGLGRLLGFGLAEDSWTDANLKTIRFQKTLTIPAQGVTRISAQVKDGRLSVRVIQPDGGTSGYSASGSGLSDDLSLLYDIRVNPRQRGVHLIDTYELINGRLVALGKRTMTVPAGRYLVDGYVLEQGPARVAVWIAQDRERLPAYVSFGQGFSQVVGRLTDVRR